MPVGGSVMCWGGCNCASGRQCDLLGAVIVLMGGSVVCWGLLLYCW